MVAAVRGVPMTIDADGLLVSERCISGLLDVARAFGFNSKTLYLNALEREGPKIFDRMVW